MGLRALRRLRGRDYLTLKDVMPEEFRALVLRSLDYKRGLVSGTPLTRKYVAGIFEKPSTRTRVSFSVAVSSLGGTFLNLPKESLQISRGETLKDTALVLSRFVDAIAARVKSHNTLTELASWADVPVINLLSDRYHPLQALADVVTIVESFGGRKVDVAFVGDGSANTCASLMFASVLMGYNFRVGAPESYMPREDDLKFAKRLAELTGSEIDLTEDPKEAVKDVHVIYTDTWFSMGVLDIDKRKEIFPPYQVNSELLKAASPEAIVMHCQPWFLGQEITEEVAYGPRSRAFDEAENRLHTSKAVLEAILGI